MFRQEYYLQGFNFVSVAGKEGEYSESSVWKHLLKRLKKEWWLRYRAVVKAFSSDSW